MLTLEGCRLRQGRLLAHMQKSGLDSAILSRPKTVYYFSGALVDPTWPQALVVDRNGEWTLLTNAEPAQAAATVAPYTGYTLERPFGRESGHDELVSGITVLNPGIRIGVEPEHLSAGAFAALGTETQSLTPAIVEMRRRKDPDEIACMRETIRLTEAGYRAIKERLEPGMTEVQAYTIIGEAIAGAAGTSVDLKGDFACGTRAIKGGGPPTQRRAGPGDLYILDLFPSYEGYVCDLCRTFAVGGASQAQQDAWAHVLAGHEIAKRLLRPGTPGRVLYEEIRAHLDLHPETQGSFTHHAGHGVGMDGWEQPWLNRGSDQALIEGEVIACEPGLYSESLNGGIRLEHNYLISAGGPVALDTFPMEL